MILTIYTDGACHPPSQTGAWAALIFAANNEEDTLLQGIVTHTTHQRMELTAAIEALYYAEKKAMPLSTVALYTDSQYVADLPTRRKKIVQGNFITKKGNLRQNTDLLQVFFGLLDRVEVELYKVKAHQKQGDLPNHNRRVDKWVRKVLREHLRS
ncbi:ribonuclease H family protein [Microscilla marina]|uniref:ribonuclease H n=1 Tax=Microscilla marina ATCC 23134 TaxID=313606 RepID=A1ZUH8_MICM2|nr:ribonuclease H [Microscilla marina]EAY25997.1 RNase H [Microscilla marina ATCC 23134]